MTISTYHHHQPPPPHRNRPTPHTTIDHNHHTTIDTTTAHHLRPPPHTTTDSTTAHHPHRVVPETMAIRRPHVLALPPRPARPDRPTLCGLAPVDLLDDVVRAAQQAELPGAVGELAAGRG